MTHSPTFADVRAAAERLKGEAVRTPLIRASLPNGGTVFFKCEVLQRTGSFKFRGAYNRISQIPVADRAKGVVACSSGNHGQGVAYVARMFGMPATIVMPNDAPAMKIRRTRELGAEVVLYDRETEDRDGIANAISQKSGAAFVHPYNDPGVIAGQGTVGLEVIEDLAALGLTADAMLVCVSGGGLLGGISLAFEELSPTTQVYSVEPAGFDDYARSLAAGQIVGNVRNSGSICDALMANSPGSYGWEIAKRRSVKGLVVTDEEAIAASAFAARELKLVVEPGGAVALAALLSGKLATAGETVVAMLSGGNMSDEMMIRALS